MSHHKKPVISAPILITDSDQSLRVLEKRTDNVNMESASEKSSWLNDTWNPWGMFKDFSTMSGKDKKRRKVDKSQISGPIPIILAPSEDNKRHVEQLSRVGLDKKGLQHIGQAPDTELLGRDGLWRNLLHSQRPDTPISSPLLPPSSVQTSPSSTPKLPPVPNLPPPSLSVDKLDNLEASKSAPLVIQHAQIDPILAHQQAMQFLKDHDDRMAKEQLEENLETPKSPSLEPVRSRPISRAPTPSRPDLTYKRQSKLKELENQYKSEIFETRMDRLKEEEDATIEEHEKEELVKLPKQRNPASMSIHAAAYNNQLDRVIDLVECGRAGPNDWDERFGGVTPLHLSSMRGWVELSRYLLNKGADPNAKAGPILATPFHYACRFGQLETIDLLYKSGADPTIKDAQGFDCLDLAQHSASLPCVIYLVSIMGSLWQACFYGVVERASYLIENGLAMVDDVWVTQKSQEALPARTSSNSGATLGPGQGVTGLHLACIRGHVAMVKYLLEAGANANAVTSPPSLSTPLHLCSSAPPHLQVDIAKLLLKHGGDARKPDGHGWNALVVAKLKGIENRQLCELFIAPLEEGGAGMVDATEGVQPDMEKALPEIPESIVVIENQVDLEDLFQSSGTGHERRQVAIPLSGAPTTAGWKQDRLEQNAKVLEDLGIGHIPMPIAPSPSGPGKRRRDQE